MINLFIALVLGIGQLSIPATPQKYVPNYAEVVTLYHWKAARVLWFDDDVDEASRKVILDGFKEWKTTFSVTEYRCLSNVTIATPHLKKYPGHGKVIGITWYTPILSGEIEQAEVAVYVWPHINQEMVKETAAHEFGHVLGIGGHSPFRGDLMYPYHTRDNSGHPSEADLNTLYEDYGGKPD